MTNTCIPIKKNIHFFDASFLVVAVYNGEKTLKTMETITEIPVLKKSKLTREGKEVEASASCCAPKNNASVCCTPSEEPEDNGGACCAQPSDGSACCDK